TSSRPPNAFRVSATRRSQSAARVTSARTKTAVPAAASIAATTFRPRASSRPDTTTLASSSAKSRAAASPSPEVAPVTMATRSGSFIAEPDPAESLSRGLLRAGDEPLEPRILPERIEVGIDLEPTGREVVRDPQQGLELVERLLRLAHEHVDPSEL